MQNPIIAVFLQTDDNGHQKYTCSDTPYASVDAIDPANSEMFGYELVGTVEVEPRKLS